DVTVSTPGGPTAPTPADLFTYAAAPTVTAVSPTSGPVAGGSAVTITGTGLAGATGVAFGAAPAGFIFDADASITAVAPPAAAAPTVTVVDPAGPLSGGTVVTITGAGLSGATAVAFGGAPAGFTVNSDTSITAVAPPGAAGPVDVTVTTPGGTSAASPADVF